MMHGPRVGALVPLVLLFPLCRSEASYSGPTLPALIESQWCHHGVLVFNLKASVITTLTRDLGEVATILVADDIESVKGLSFTPACVIMKANDRDQAAEMGITKVIWLATNVNQMLEDWTGEAEVFAYSMESAEDSAYSFNFFCHMAMYGNKRIPGGDLRDCGRRASLQPRMLQVSVMGTSPFVVYGPNGALDGVDLALVRSVAKKMHFKLRYKRERTWGTRIANGTLIGTLGSVARGTSQFGVGHIIMTYDRTKVVDFIHAYQIDAILVAARPAPLPRYLNILKPFNLTVWICVLGTLILVMAFVPSLSLLRTRSGRSLKKLKHEDVVADVLAVYGSHLGEKVQTRIYRKTYVSGQLTFLFWIVYVFLVTASYQCNLRAYLMVTDYEKPIDTPEDVIAQDRQFHLPYGSIFNMLLVTSPNPAKRQLEQIVLKNNNFFYHVKGKMPDELQENIINEGHVTMKGKTQMMSALYEQARSHGVIRPYRLGKRPLFNFLAGMVVPKHAWYREEASDVVARLVEAGVVQKIVNLFVPPWYSYDSLETLQPSAFQMEHIFAAVLVFVCGNLLSLASFGFEIAA